MPKIFISYRRSDTQDVTGRIRDHLEQHFDPREEIFTDIDNIPPGVDFREYLAKAIERCDVLLAIIGEKWFSIAYEEGPRTGTRRLDDPDDFVRIEVSTALRRDIPVVPVLVQQATMPKEASLPDDIRLLAFKNALEVRSGRDFRVHVGRLLGTLKDPSNWDAWRHTKPAELAAGTFVADRFELDRPLGSDASGSVWLASRHPARESVVLRLVPPDLWKDPCAKKRMYDAYMAARRLKYAPMVVPITDLLEHHGLAFLVSDHVEGLSLRAMIEERKRTGRGPWSEEELKGLVIGLAQGLDEAHETGVIHGCLRTSKVFYGRARNIPFIKVADFGVAWELGRFGLSHGHMGGLSPEQTAGEEPDRRSDVYVTTSTTGHPRSGIPGGRPRALPGLCAGGRGAATRATCAVPAATAATRRSRATTADSAVPGASLNKMTFLKT